MLCSSQFLIPLPYAQAMSNLGFREWRKGCCRPVRDRSESQKRTLVCSVSCRRIHKALILVLLLAFLNQIRFNQIFQKGKTQYTVLYFETTVTRRPFQNSINLILINRNQKGSLSAMSSQNCFFKVLWAILVIR